jgi:hypothetical protein
MLEARSVFIAEEITGLIELRHKILTRITKLCQYIKQERVWTTKESELHSRKEQRDGSPHCSAYTVFRPQQTSHSRGVSDYVPPVQKSRHEPDHSAPQTTEISLSGVVPLFPQTSSGFSASLNTGRTNIL